MAELIRKEVIIANTADIWEALRNAPKVNEAVVKDDNTSQSLNIVWKGTSAEYQALPLKHPDTLYIVTDSEMPTIPKNYVTHINKPKVNGIELVDDISLDEIDVYNQDAIDAMLRQVGKIFVVAPETWEQIVADPTLGFANSLYYVETDVEGAYDTYMMDSNRAITYIGSNDAFFGEYQKCHPIIKVGGLAKNEIKIADGTVEGAIKDLGDEKELETVEKSSAVKAMNEIDSKKLGQEFISHTLTQFGEWNGTKADRYYKLATVEFNSRYEYFTATLKLLSDYANFKMTGTEIDFNFRAGATSSDALQIHEFKSYDVPQELAEEQVYIYIYYDKPSSFPQTAEIWMVTKGKNYQEFQGDWQFKNTFPSYPLATFNPIEKPVHDPSYSHLTGGNFYIDLGKQRNNMMVLEGEMNTVLSGQTRTTVRSRAGTRTGYVESLVSFTKAESPDESESSVYNVHVMNAKPKTTLFATNIETNHEYRSVYDGSSWSDWIYVYGVDGGLGALQDITTSPSIDYGEWSKTTVNNLKFTYNCIDMGEYYINEIRMRFVDANSNFSHPALNSKYLPHDNILMKFSSIKGKPIVDGKYYATGFLTVERAKSENLKYYNFATGCTYIKSDKTIMFGPRYLHSDDWKESSFILPGAFYVDDPRYPYYLEYNFLTRK